MRTTHAIIYSLAAVAVAALVTTTLSAQQTRGSLPIKVLSASRVGVNAATLDATVTGSSFDTRGWNRMSVTCQHVNNSAEELQLVVEHNAGGGWDPHNGSDTSNDGTNINEVVHPHQVDWAVAADEDLHYGPVTILAPNTRLVITDTAGGASDTVTCQVTLGAW